MSRRVLAGRIERIGPPEATFVVKGLNQADNFTRSVTAANHTAAVGMLMDWIEARIRRGELTAVRHRVVHGGPKYSEPQRITTEMIEELHQLQTFDPEHLPEEIVLTESFSLTSATAQAWLQSTPANLWIPEDLHRQTRRRYAGNPELEVESGQSRQTGVNPVGCQDKDELTK
jgi:hypothetical protein